MIHPSSFPSVIPKSKITAPVDAGVHSPSQSLIFAVEDRMGTKLLDESFSLPRSGVIFDDWDDLKVESQLLEWNHPVFVLDPSIDSMH
jgi:hypothetical protein